MESRSVKVRTLSIATSVLLLVVLVLVNAVFARTSVRLDLTEENRFTLNDGSRKVLSALEDPATVKLFWHNVPASASPTRRYLEGLLEEMQDASNDHLQIQWIDMEDDAGLREAQEMGVPEYVFGDVRGDEVRQSKGYMSLAIELGDEQPLILDRLHDQRDQLEYRIVAELYRRSRIATPVVGLVAGDASFFMGNAPPRFAQLSAILKETFGSAFRAKVTTSDPIPPDIDVLIVAGPKDWDEVKAYNLEQFVLRGGRLLLMLDPVNVDVLYARGATGQPARSGLESWLEHLGVSVDTGVVGDFQNMGMFVVEGLRRYPYWPIATNEDADKTNPVARSLPPMLMRWPVGFSIDDQKQTATKRTASILATTSKNGYRRPDLLGLQRSVDSHEGKLLEQIPLMMLLEGPIQSYWNGKDIPLPAAPPAPGELPELPDDGGDDGEATGSPDGEATGSPDGEMKPADPAPKDDQPKGDEPKGDEPKGDEPKGDEPKGDEPKKDPPEDPEPATDGAPGPAADAEDDGADPAPAPDEDPPGDASDEPADEGSDEAEEPAKPKADPRQAKARENHLASGTGRIILVGDAGMVSDAWLAMRGASQMIFLLAQFNGMNGVAGFNVVRNATDWLTGSEELLSLRSRNDNPRTLDKVERDDQEAIQWLNILLVPFLVLVAGLVVFVVRRR